MLHPVVLSGGSGTRLWPLSRQDRPKQFLSLIGQRSLFQETVLRAAVSGWIGPSTTTWMARLAPIARPLRRWA